MRFPLSVLLMCLVSVTALQAQQFKTAIDYNDYIVDQQNAIGKEIISFNEQIAVETSTRETVEPFYKHMVEVTRTSVRNVKAMSPYEGNMELRDASIALFEFYLDIFQKEYVEFLDIVFAETPTEESYARMEELMADIGKREASLDQRFQNAQSEFARAHGFTLEENELQEEIDGE